MTSSAKTLADYGGCIYSQSANIPGSNNGTERFPGIRRGIDNAELALGPIVVELAQLFQIMPHLGFYDDSKSCSGNAAADRRSLFPVVPNLPFKVEGTIVLGTKLFNKLSQYKNQTAAIAAVCAHEFGHLLQFKYVDQELRQIRDNEGSVVRIELFADFICGYHAGIRKLRQDDYPAVIQALNQFRAG